jgi:hypothetical protein
VAGRKRAAVLVAFAALFAVALTVGVSTAATKKVVVVRGKGFTLTAWSAHNELCFKLKAGKPSSSQCAEKLVTLPGRVNFTEFAYKPRNASYVGGASTKKIVKVVASFADGKTLTMKTKRVRAYRGKFRKTVRFWAGKRTGTAPLRSIVGKSARGATVEQETLPAPAPLPSPQPPPCGCGPPRAAIVCPLQRPMCE